MPNPERQEGEPLPEKGANVRIVIKFIRHGERTTTGELTDYGREVTRERARSHKIDADDFDAVKAFGSTAGPKGPTGMQRSLETAHIYAEEAGREKQFKTRGRDILSYEKIETPTPYNHTVLYNANLPKNFDELPDVEKAEAAKVAQQATLDHLLSLDSPEAMQFKKETAGSFAVFLDKYMHMAKRLNSGSRVLQPAGTHGGSVELFLQQALVRTGDGKEVVGLEHADEIGGPVDPSESFDVEITTNERGELQRLNVRFDDPKRPTGEMWIDLEKLQELKAFYKEMHREE